MTDTPFTLDLGGRRPDVDPTAWLAPGSTVVGEVALGPESSVWYGAVLRGDMGPIAIGRGSNIQDGCVVHTDPGFPVSVGSGVSVGHRAVLHGCTVEDDALIGMGAVVLNGAVIGRGSLVAAGAVVTQGKMIPPHSLVAGVPANVVRELTEEERAGIRLNGDAYRDLAVTHRQAVEKA
ncbi:gamma carbonic anhydrase family protein [Streptacidiphilus monticola]|uniref:Gamma carbonic anhydrase family protein n=1 Tax=Streptacidiphilus monticola TaxID=2161674 RepID=A0ABW1G2K5_9ACTN